MLRRYRSMEKSQCRSRRLTMWTMRTQKVSRPWALLNLLTSPRWSSRLRAPSPRKSLKRWAWCKATSRTMKRKAMTMALLSWLRNRQQAVMAGRTTSLWRRLRRLWSIEVSLNSRFLCSQRNPLDRANRTRGRNRKMTSSIGPFRLMNKFLMLCKRHLSSSSCHKLMILSK